MSGQIIKLTDFAASITKYLKSMIAEEQMKISITSIMVGENEASKSYFAGIQKKAKDFGIDANCQILPAQTTTEELLKTVSSLNNDPNCYGIMLQMPLPKHIDSKTIFNSIDYRKDIDGMHIINQGYLFKGEPLFIPATAWAVDVFLEYFAVRFNYNLTGKVATIVGRSNTVGKPAAHLLLAENMTVNICHTKTVNPAEICKQSDVLVVACGVPKFVNANFVKDGAVIVDVGIHRTEEGTLCGDVDANDVISKASYVTAVPGGVGSLTSTLLLANAIKSYYLINKEQLLQLDFTRLD